MLRANLDNGGDSHRGRSPAAWCFRLAWGGLVLLAVASSVKFAVSCLRESRRPADGAVRAWMSDLKPIVASLRPGDVAIATSRPVSLAAPDSEADVAFYALQSLVAPRRVSLERGLPQVVVVAPDPADLARLVAAVGPRYQVAARSSRAALLVSTP